MTAGVASASVADDGAPFDGDEAPAEAWEVAFEAGAAFDEGDEVQAATNRLLATAAAAMGTARRGPATRSAPRLGPALVVVTGFDTGVISLTAAT